jgi:glycosyltransferase involved in cell wall biosynthesis
MMMPLVSVIVPVYNSKPYLMACIESVLQQDYRDIEVICIDDGSADGSGELLREIARRDERVKIIVQENKGLASARNSGISNAKGKYIWFVDSDDQIENDSIRSLVEIAERENLDQVIFGTTVILDKEAKTVGRRQVVRFESYYAVKNDDLVFEPVWSGMDLFARLVEHDNFYVSVPLRFIRKSILDENGLRFNEGLIHEDNYFTPLLILRSRRIRLISDKYYLRRLHDGSTMTEQRAELRHTIGFLGNILRLIGDLKDSDLMSLCVRHAMFAYCKNQIWGACLNFCAADSDATAMVLKSIGGLEFSDAEKRFTELAILPLLESVRESRQKRKANKFLRLSGRLRKWFIRRK